MEQWTFFSVPPKRGEKAIFYGVMGVIGVVCLWFFASYFYTAYCVIKATQ